MTSTKEKIIYESLNLFSQKGYEGISMRDIAAAVGIKGASIYNHFKGKEEIFYAIITKMSNRYDMAVASIPVPSGAMEEIVEFYINITSEHLYELSKALLLFFLKDDFASKFRKMLTIERYRNKLAEETFKRYFFDMPIQFQTQLFQSMKEKGVFGRYDSKIMAFHFYAPIYLLMNQYDEEDKLDDLLLLVKNHVYQFSKIYK